MGHQPHLYLPGPWEGEAIAISANQQGHLFRVLRARPGESMSYTDGLGRLGEGTLSESTVTRGAEIAVERPSRLVMAVAPPSSRDRQRMVVEKLAELGVERLVWLRTIRGEGRVPNRAKLQSWTISALEQSRSAWLMETSATLVGWDDLEAPVVACDPDGTVREPEARTIAVGPEGGWQDGEVPDGVQLLGLGATVLRVETAAIVAAAFHR